VKLPSFVLINEKIKKNGNEFENPAKQVVKALMEFSKANEHHTQLQI
jgi:hypothetical protein